MLNIYFITLAFIIPFCLLKKNKMMYMFIIIIFIMGFRDNATISVANFRQSDEYAYRNFFNSLIGTPFDITNIKSLEWVRYLLDWTIANTIGNSQVWIFIYSLITNFLFLRFIHIYVYPLWYGLFLFITIGLYTFQTNAIMSVTSAAILTLAIEPLLKRNRLKYFLIVAVAIGFHFSAIVMIPLYFLINNKIFRKSIIFWEILSLIIAINFKIITNFILIYTPYSQYLYQINSEKSYGVNIFRVLIFNIIYVFILYFSKKIKSISKVDLLFLKYTKILLFINILSSSYVYVHRFNELFSFTLIYMIPRICNSFNLKNRKIIIFIICILFFCFGIQQNKNILCENVIIRYLKNF